MTAQALDAAFVLHTRRYRDSSLLLDLYTRQSGRVACIAKGALRSRSRQSGLQPFQRLWVELKGRGEVSTLAQSDPAERALSLSGRLLYCGLYVNELMLRLTVRQDPNAGLFADYAETLLDLAHNPLTEGVLRRFEVRLLAHLGLGLTLDVDANGDPIDADARYMYQLEHGPCLSTGEDQAIVSGATLLALQQEHFATDEQRREARVLMRRVLHYHLDGVPLRSRELFR